MILQIPSNKPLPECPPEVADQEEYVEADPPNVSNYTVYIMQLIFIR